MVNFDDIDFKDLLMIDLLDILVFFLKPLISINSFFETSALNLKHSASFLLKFQTLYIIRRIFSTGISLCLTDIFLNVRKKKLEIQPIKSYHFPDFRRNYSFDNTYHLS